MTQEKFVGLAIISIESEILLKFGLKNMVANFAKEKKQGKLINLERLSLKLNFSFLPLADIGFF